MKDTLITLSNKDSVRIDASHYNTIVKVDNTPAAKTNMDYFVMWFPPLLAAIVALTGIWVAYWNIKRQVRKTIKQQWITDFRKEVTNWVTLIKTLEDAEGKVKSNLDPLKSEALNKDANQLVDDLMASLTTFTLYLDYEGNKLHKEFNNSMVTITTKTIKNELVDNDILVNTIIQAKKIIEHEQNKI